MGLELLKLASLKRKKRTNSTERGVASASTGDTVHIDKGET